MRGWAAPAASGELAPPAAGRRAVRGAGSPGAAPVLAGLGLRLGGSGLNWLDSN